MSNPTTNKSSNRVIELDALRALAAINLMLFHFTHVYQVKYGFSTPLGFEFPYGKYGVQLFFMLSGFVNAMTLCRKRETDEFVASRLIRILPSFYLVVGLNLVLLTLMPLSNFSSYTVSQTVANLSVMPNLFGFECLEPVTWTLQIEILFYGILVFLFLSGAMENPFRTLMAYLLLCLVGGQIVLNMSPDATQSFAGWMVVLLSDVMLLKYMPLFAIGIFLHHLKSKPESRRTSVIGIIVSAIVFHLIDDHGHNPAATLILIGLLGFAAYGKIALLRTRFFVFLSSISYSLYLLHNNLGCVVMHQLDHLGVKPVFCFIFVMFFSVATAAAATTWVERPLSGWLREKWLTQRPVVRERIAAVASRPKRGLATVDVVTSRELTNRAMSSQD